MEEMKIRQRHEIPVEDTWVVEDMYATDEVWEQELATLAEDQEYLTGFAGKLAQDAETLYAYLERMEQTNAKMELLGNYCMRKADVDTRNSFYQAMSGKFMGIAVGMSAAIAFETPEIMAISDETMDAFYAECPKLERYRRYLTDKRRRKEHILSPAEEKLLAAAGEMAGSPDNIYGSFAYSDMTFEDAVDGEGKTYPLTQGNFFIHETSTDRQLRKSAYENLYHGLGEYKNTAAAMLNAQFKQLKF